MIYLSELLYYVRTTLLRIQHNNYRRGNTTIVMSVRYIYNMMHHNEADKRRNKYVYFNIMLSIVIIVIIILYLVIGRALLCLICHMHIIYNLFKRVWRWIWCTVYAAHLLYVCTTREYQFSSSVNAWYILLYLYSNKGRYVKAISVIAATPQLRTYIIYMYPAHKGYEADEMIIVTSSARAALSVT